MVTIVTDPPTDDPTITDPPINDTDQYKILLYDTNQYKILSKVEMYVFDNTLSTSAKTTVPDEENFEGWFDVTPTKYWETSTNGGSDAWGYRYIYWDGDEWIFQYADYDSQQITVLRLDTSVFMADIPDGYVITGMRITFGQWNSYYDGTDLWLFDRPDPSDSAFGVNNNVLLTQLDIGIPENSIGHQHVVTPGDINIDPNAVNLEVSFNADYVYFLAGFTKIEFYIKEKSPD